MVTYEAATIGTVTYMAEERRKGFRLQVFALIGSEEDGDRAPSGGVIAYFDPSVRASSHKGQLPSVGWYRQQRRAA